MSTVILHAVVLLAYLASGVVYGANLALKTPAHLRRARLLAVAGVALHTAAIGTLCVRLGESPFASAFGTLSITAWVVALLFVVVEWKGRLPVLGALAMPVCCLLLFGAFLRPRAIRGTTEIHSKFINIHILLVLISFALFALAACCAVFYIWQYGLLKHPDRRGLFRRLPPLETVDRLAYHLVAFALPLLTLGLALGIERAAAGGLRGNWIADPHTIVSLVAWLVYGAYMLARTVGGWRGTRPNYLLIAGMAVTLALFFIPSTTHRFT